MFRIAPGTASSEKLGQPQPASNLVSGLEQFGAAADAVIAAVSPVRLVLAGERTLCGGVARHLEGAAFGAFLGEQRLPFGFGLFNGCGHDEQLISMEEAQSGGKPAEVSKPACSSNGVSSSFSKVAVPV